MWSESWPHLVYGHTGGGRVHTVDIHPLGMSVNDQQEHLSHERSRIIYVHSRPRAAQPFPRVWWRTGRALLVTLTSSTTFHLFKRLDSCDFLCWFKPIMLPPADFRLAKIVTETESPPLIHRMAKRFQRCGDIRRNFTVRRNTTFCSIVCCEIFF